MKRSKHSLSHYKLATMDMGKLVPISCYEVLPGDTIQQATSALIRVTPLNAPVMHPVHVRIHHWFVPYRLIWSDWEDFITGGPLGTNSSSPPYIEMTAAIGSLADYLGVPTGTALSGAANSPSALPFRAYDLIWNEFYRDQDLDTELTIDLTDGVDTTTNTTLKNVSWEKDYFTTARPWTQKGTAVSLPLGTSAPVLGIGAASQTYQAGPVTVYESDGTSSSYATYRDSNAAGNDNNIRIEQAGTSGYPNIRADLANATAATINDLREAFALQRYKEARARYGSRYVEYLRYLGVKSSDARLQRPEYLGGGKQTIQFSEVLQTGVTTSGNSAGVGTLRGHGVGSLRSNRYRRFFEEHGVVLTLMSTQPKTIYAQGLSRMWSRRTKEDFFQKELQFIGQQEVYNRELYVAHSSPAGVFGYQDRYDEYRRLESGIAGEFRDSTYNSWHMARIFSSDPALNASFVNSNPTDRIYASTTPHELQVMAMHSIQARRMVSKMGTSSVF